MMVRNVVLNSFLVLSVVLCCATLFSAQGPVAPEKPKDAFTQQRVFVFVQRTDRHAKYSSPEMFHDAMNAVVDYLKEKNVAIAKDEFGGRDHAEGATPMETVFNIAKDAKADNLLYVVVDRPITKWLKVTMQSYDMNGKLLWEEKGESGCGLSGKHGLEVTTKKVHEALDKHIGKDGLPIVMLTETGPSAQAQ